GADVALAGQGEVLDIGGKNEVGRALDQVDTFAGGFEDKVAGLIDDVSVVALAAAHVVGAGAAVDHVGSVIAEEIVVERIAGDVEGGVSQQLAGLDIVGEREGDGRPLGVVAASGTAG